MHTLQWDMIYVKDSDIPESIDDCVSDSEKVLYKHYKRYFRRQPLYKSTNNRAVRAEMANIFACRKVRDYRVAVELDKTNPNYSVKRYYDRILLQYMSNPDALNKLK